MSKTRATNKPQELTEGLLNSAYQKHILLNGKRPHSVYAFMMELGYEEELFYQFYNSFDNLESGIWENWIKSTISSTQQDDAFAQYSVREKMLAFYFTWLEYLKANRSFVSIHHKELKNPLHQPQYLQVAHTAFNEFINDLLMQGKDTMEIAERPFSNQYAKIFWQALIWLTVFWLEDNSKGFEKTDAAIEKSINFSFDLLAKGPLDSFIDLAKFLYQTRAN